MQNVKERSVLEISWESIFEVFVLPRELFYNFYREIHGNRRIACIDPKNDRKTRCYKLWGLARNIHKEVPAIFTVIDGNPMRLSYDYDEFHGIFHVKILSVNIVNSSDISM